MLDSPSATPRFAPLFDPGQHAGKLFVGQWIDADERVPLKEPATGQTICEMGFASARQITEAAKRAREAQREWVNVPPERKRELLIKADEVAKAHRAEWLTWLQREIGATEKKAMFEVAFASDEILEAASYPTQHTGAMLADRAGRLSYGLRTPYGVCACMTPSNVPVVLGARVIAPALAAGNAVLVKPQPACPISGGVAFARIFQDAGFPDGLIQVLPADGKATETFETDPIIRMIHFTGSTATGQRIAEIAGRTLKKVSISASGKNPIIVLDDANLAEAVQAAGFSQFFFGGQSCMGLGKHLVHRSLLDHYVSGLKAFAEKLVVDNPMTNKDAYYGPIIKPDDVDRLQKLVDDAVARGATLVLKGGARKPYFDPTILTGVGPGMRIWAEETFGPIAAIRAFDSDDEAVELANDTDYGLSASVFGTVDRAHALARRLEHGMVHVNDRSIDDCAYVPFGGVKQSGNGGRYGSTVNWDEYTEWRWYTVTGHATAPAVPS